MLVAAVTNVWLFWKANQHYLKNPMNVFMKYVLKRLRIVIIVEAYFLLSKGALFVGMLKCPIVGHEKYSSAIGIAGEL